MKTMELDQLGAHASRIVYGARSVSLFTGNTFPEKLDSLAAWHFHLADKKFRASCDKPSCVPCNCSGNPLAHLLTPSIRIRLQEEV